MEEEFVELNALLQSGSYKQLKYELSELPYQDVAEFIMSLDDEMVAVTVFRILSKDSSAGVFAYLDADVQQDIVKHITDSEIGRLMDDLMTDDAVDFLEEVPANIVKRVLANTDKETRETINRFLHYPENSAGSIMTDEMVELHDTLTVGDAIKNIRRTGVDKETIYTCYVIDSTRKLVGTLPLRRLILNDEDIPITEIMNDDEMVISVSTMDDQEEIAAIAKKYDLLSIPVVDKENRLVGIITIDDIVDIIDDEATEDFEKMALLQPSDSEYMKTNVFKLAKNRIVWLLILMISATFTGQIIEGFEGKLAAIAGLTACIPMIMDTGGNSGNQVSTLIIRGLALGEIKIKDYFKILWKEIRVAVMVGTVLGIVNYGRMILLNVILHNDTQTPVIITVCLTVVCTVIVAKCIGCTLPIIAKSLKLDPALMAGPMITTVVDALSLLIYFGIANVIISI